ncbi:hypothetical protein TYRP_001307 [Tyrophagus putrescentiae]|nr:hypothetical protein TYRP_001307 [Tyrophagus putrescentiae]
MSQISDDCDPETNGGKGPSTSEANNARYSVPDDYDNNDDLKLQKSGFGNGESPTKEEGASNVTLPFENRRYSAKDIERKCKDKNIWCQEYMNCLRRIHKASDIFPELEDIGEITLPKETGEYIKKICKRYNLNENACKDLERSARKGIAFKQLLGRLVEGTERRGRKNNTNSYFRDLCVDNCSQIASRSL